MTEPGLTPPSEPFEPYEPATPPWGEAEPEPAAPYPPTAAPAPYTIAPQYVAATGGQAHGMAIAALVLGILGVLAVPLAVVTGGLGIVTGVCSPFAIWLGLWSRGLIDAQPSVYGNRGMATAGFVLGIIGLALLVVAVLVVVAIVAFFIWLFSSISAGG